MNKLMPLDPLDLTVQFNIPSAVGHLHLEDHVWYDGRWVSTMMAPTDLFVFLCIRVEAVFCLFCFVLLSYR